MSYLKTVAHSAKIYVRPLQRDLSIEVENTAEDYDYDNAILIK